MSIATIQIGIKLFQAWILCLERELTKKDLNIFLEILNDLESFLSIKPLSSDDNLQSSDTVSFKNSLFSLMIFYHALELY